MNFQTRIKTSGVSASVQKLIGGDMRKAKRLSESFEQYYQGIHVINALWDKSASKENLRRGAEAFAIWIAARRFVAVNLPGRNEEGCLLSQAETSLILLAQLVLGSDNRHPALKGIEVGDFMRSVEDAYSAYSLELTLDVHQDRSGISAHCFIDDPSDDLGGCSVGTTVEAKKSRLLPRVFRKALFERCRQVNGEEFSHDRLLYSRIYVEKDDWLGLLKYMDSPTPRKPKPRVIRRTKPRPLFADLAAA